MGPHETYLIEDRTRSRLNWTQDELEHVRHLDTGCPVCADDAKCHHAASERAERMDQARAVLAVGILDITQRMDRTDLEPLTVGQVRAALDKLMKAHGRIFRG